MPPRDSDVIVGWRCRRERPTLPHSHCEPLQTHVLLWLQGLWMGAETSSAVMSPRSELASVLLYAVIMSNCCPSMSDDGVSSSHSHSTGYHGTPMYLTEPPRCPCSWVATCLPQAPCLRRWPCLRVHKSVILRCVAGNGVGVVCVRGPAGVAPAGSRSHVLKFPGRAATPAVPLTHTHSLVCPSSHASNDCPPPPWAQALIHYHL
jgi:hypothetical protein